MSSRVFSSFAGSIVLLAACSTTPPATDQEKRDAMFAYLACLHAAARQADDGKSDASTIAFGIKSRCLVEFTVVMKLQAQSAPNPEARRMFEERFEKRQLEIATSVVLDERKQSNEARR